jgi:hypothetical protein
MRKVADEDRIRRFMRALGAEAEEPARIYFTGGATAVLLGWRAATIDVDIRVFPECDRLYRAIPALKESLELNVELASPADFIPELPGWEKRSVFVGQENRLSFHHYDLYAQALAKIERGHTQDLLDVQEMIHRRLIAPPEALRHFTEIEPRLYLYPAIDPPSFRRAVERILGQEDPPKGFTP